MGTRLTLSVLVPKEPVNAMPPDSGTSDNRRTTDASAPTGSNMTWNQTCQLTMSRVTALPRKASVDARSTAAFAAAAIAWLKGALMDIGRG
jgi:hypothetical protein